MTVSTIIPLNKFRSIGSHLTTQNTLVYQTPAGVSSIILSATCSNVANADVQVTVTVQKLDSSNNTFTYTLIPNVTIFPYDVLSAVSGRLVLEEYDSLYAYASSNASIDFVMSMNEAANE